MKKKNEKQFAVIGLGRFGSSVAKTLVELGAEVLAIDKSEEKVNHASYLGVATHAVQADATDETALKAIGIRNFDVVLIGLGEIQTSVLTAMLCKEENVPFVMAKTTSDVHSKLLTKVGVDRVVFPERDTGMSVAHNLLSANVLEFIELSKDYGIAEIGAHVEWLDHSLIELNFRKKYGLNVIAIKSPDGAININPMPADKIMQGSVVVVVGKEQDINDLEETRKK